jgi:acyl-CoA reductase-like NAD-dependent aldehyde dehydrogenase
MEVIVVADLVRYFAKHAPEMLAPEPIPLHLMKHRASYLHFVPRGVIGIIAPWNFPFSIPIGETMMSLIAGNGVVLKPSEVTPLIAQKARELYLAAELPPDLFQVVTGRGPCGAMRRQSVFFCKCVPGSADRAARSLLSATATPFRRPCRRPVTPADPSGRRVPCCG